MATPIETNTEELQETLQTVYDLSMAGGGSAEPDLVIGLNVDNIKLCPDGSSAPHRSLDYMTLDDVSILSGSVSATAEKIKQGLPVKVLLNEVHFYWDNRWSVGVGEASGVQLVSEEVYPNEGNPYIVATFFLSDMPGSTNYACFMKIGFSVTAGNPLLYRCFILANAN